MTTLKERIKKALAWDGKKVLTTRDAYLHPDNCPSEGWTYRSSYEAGAKDHHRTLTSKWQPIIEDMAAKFELIKNETDLQHCKDEADEMLAKLHKMLEGE